MAKYIDSIDFNPIIVYPDNYYVVDAKILLKSIPALSRKAWSEVYELTVVSMA